MSKATLTAEDQRVIDEWTAKWSAGLEALEKARQLNVGDYLVLYVGPDKASMKLELNSYGAPVKYKVVHSTKHGIPFIKRVNKKGNPIGEIMSCTGSLDSDNYHYGGGAYEFRLDPDFADSIILEDLYDPAALHRSKQQIWKDVTEHNKSAKVNTRLIQDVVAFFNTVNVGDTLWTSTVGYYIVHDKQIMTRQDFKSKVRDLYTNAKGPYVTVLTVVDKKGKTHKITADFFHRRALYREKPRSYKELKI